VTQAAPFHLIADSPDGAPLRIRRTMAGDAWDRAEAEACGVPSHSGTAAGGAVSLGMPTLGLRPTAPHTGSHAAAPSLAEHSAAAPSAAAPSAAAGAPAVNASSTVPIYAVDDGER